MTDLIPCKYCGGQAEVYKDWIDTAFGDRPVIGYRCEKCHARTSLYMTNIDGTEDEEMLEHTKDLWNRGRIGGL